MAVIDPRQERLSTYRHGYHPQTIYPLVKRVFDVGVCVAALPFLILVVPLIALAVMIDSPGSPFFLQERVGRNGRCFTMFKFRTMRADHSCAEDNAFMTAFVAGDVEPSADTVLPAFKPNHQAAITRVGRLLRKTSMDELPQIFNVLRGEMSLIGPRPNLPCEVQAYADWHHRRLAVLPGITGLAQVNGRSGIPFESIVRYDVDYVERCSVMLDLQIIWLTLRQVLLGHGAG